MTSLPQIPVRKITRALERDHYVVAAYDSIEPFNQHVLVVTDDVVEPSLIVRRVSRGQPKRSNVFGMAIPMLVSFTLPLARELVRVETDYITVRRWERAVRRQGVKRAGTLVGDFSCRGSGWCAQGTEGWRLCGKGCAGVAS